jgi:hypothetical protein
VPGFDLDPDESFEQARFRAAEAQNEAGHHFLAVVTAQPAVEAVAAAPRTPEQPKRSVVPLAAGKASIL